MKKKCCFICFLNLCFVNLGILIVGSSIHRKIKSGHIENQDQVFNIKVSILEDLVLRNLTFFLKSLLPVQQILQLFSSLMDLLLGLLS